MKKNKTKIFLDNLQLCFKEYFTYCNRSGQPSLCDIYTKWLWDNQYNDQYCKIMHITPIDNSKTNFKCLKRYEFLNSFHKNDKKFIAIAIASEDYPEICNATDSHWQSIESRLEDIGIKIKQILNT